MPRVGIVVIGRNEGERLVLCLRSLAGAGDLVYVDSGSSDGSQAAAARAGATVVALDMSRPFTAARARNAGVAALPPECDIIQFVDGDCVVQPGWIEAGRDALLSDRRLGAVFGRVREAQPEASIYNWLCDAEWAILPGPTRVLGGNAMFRREALIAAGGYPEAMIAGEEPHLSIEMRTLGWTIYCLDREMVLHDAAMTRFRQWWRRSIRGGYACAELVDRHRMSRLHGFRRSLYRMLFWGGMLPAVIMICGLGGMLLGSWPLGVLALTGITLVALQIMRTTMRERHSHRLAEAARLAAFFMIAKPAQALGVFRYGWNRFRGRNATIIEYKSA
jgi:glycosyltransferase involved in cell wall biosynthesis